MNRVRLCKAMTGSVAEMLPQALYLQLPDLTIAVRSNSDALLEVLGAYFHHIVVAVDDKPVDGADTEHGSDCIEVVVWECSAPDLAVDWQDWPREAGKTGRKDTFVDLDAGGVDGESGENSDGQSQAARLIRKARTGMVFLQSRAHRIAAGPCLDNANQVINFINNQYMNAMQQQGWLICHAAAVAEAGQITAMAGFSGGGKSTMMLHLMNHPKYDYVTNDRMFIKPVGGQVGNQVMARGIPKLPRVNPGTIIHNDRLKRILSADEIAAFLALPRQQLWDLEQKYDVDISATYGQERFTDEGPLQQFIVLNWTRDSSAPTRAQVVAIEQRPELLDAIMKSSGPFYQYADGRFDLAQKALDRQAYMALLKHVTVIEATGNVDFKALQQELLLLGGAE